MICRSNESGWSCWHDKPKNSVGCLCPRWIPHSRDRRRVASEGMDVVVPREHHLPSLQLRFWRGLFLSTGIVTVTSTYGASDPLQVMTQLADLRLACMFWPVEQCPSKPTSSWRDSDHGASILVHRNAQQLQKVKSMPFPLYRMKTVRSSIYNLY
jgi:hypothetical protein